MIDNLPIPRDRFLERVISLLGIVCRRSSQETHRLTFKVLCLLRSLAVNIKNPSDHGSRKHQHSQTDQQGASIILCPMQRMVKPAQHVGFIDRKSFRRDLDTLAHGWIRGRGRGPFPQIVCAPYTKDVTILSMRLLLRVGFQKARHLPSLKTGHFTCLKND